MEIVTDNLKLISLDRWETAYIINILIWDWLLLWISMVRLLARRYVLDDRDIFCDDIHVSSIDITGTFLVRF